MNFEDQVFLNNLSILLNCNPTACKKENCPLYFKEEHACDAHRFINVFNMYLDEKFKETKVYSV